jgi:apolipoprotein N-acyltransferase
LSTLKKYRSRGAIAGAALTGLGVYFAVLQTAPFLVWVALVPLFLVLGSQSRSAYRYSGFIPGLVAGGTFSVFAFAWMISGAHSFTGASVGYGIAIFLLCVIVFSLSCALLLWRTPLVLIAPVWILAETAVQWGAEKMPWFLFHLGYALAGDLYAIQPISVIGVTGAGFVVVLVNYLVATAILRRSWRYALAPLLLAGCYMLWGWWLLPPPAEDRGSYFSLAMVTENIPPEIPWDSTNGNMRVQQLLQQEDICIAAHPQLILWSESAIPWTWSPDDDLVKELLSHSRRRSIAHVLGMNTAISPGVVRNSAYCLLPDGKVAGRYDKEYALLFIEQPWMGLQFPFLSSDGYSVEPGDNDLPLTTPEGKAGVLICNESALPRGAARRVRQGARFLLNMSNDGWFRGTWLVKQHFYNARLRAVETRKDIAVNSNNGWSGCIDASGRIDTTRFLFTIHPNDRLTAAVRHPLIPVYICLLFVLSFIIINKKPSFL